MEEDVHWIQLQILTEVSDIYSTDEACNRFAAGCITTGAGCVYPPLPTSS